MNCRKETEKKIVLGLTVLPVETFLSLLSRHQSLFLLVDFWVEFRLKKDLLAGGFHFLGPKMHVRYDFDRSKWRKSNPLSRSDVSNCRRYAVWLCA